jgi:hypothetical protein
MGCVHTTTRFVRRNPAARVEFIDENGGGAGVRLRGQIEVTQPGRAIALVSHCFQKDGKRVSVERNRFRGSERGRRGRATMAFKVRIIRSGENVVASRAGRNGSRDRRFSGRPSRTTSPGP